MTDIYDKDSYDKDIAELEKRYNDEIAKTKEYFDKTQQGEIQKRIEKLSPAYEDFILDEGEEPRDTEHIYAILDEAKKEFPKYSEVPDDHYGFEYDGEIAIREFNKWFKKWFGDAEAKTK